MLILILMDVQYLQNVVFTTGRGLNNQSHSLSGSHHMIKKVPTQQSFIPPPHPLLLFGKPCHLGVTLFFLLISK